MNQQRVVISGAGVICATGSRLLDFWQACLAGVQGAQPTPAEWLRYFEPQSRAWAPLDLSVLAARGVGRVERSQYDPVTLLASLAAEEALENASFEVTLKDPRQKLQSVGAVQVERAGVILGTGIGGANTLFGLHAHQLLHRPLLELARAEFELDDTASGSVSAQWSKGFEIPGRFNPFGVAMSMPNAAAAHLGIKFGFKGENRTVSAACASGTMAVGSAYRAIKDGRIDVALAGGTEYVGEPTGGIFRGFDAARTLARGDLPIDKVNRPFDQARSGFLFAEGGAAVLVVESLAHARARGAPVLAELAGYAESFDAHSMMSIEPSGASIEHMIMKALAEAGVSGGDIGYINAHGTGTELNDESESQIIARAFGDKALVNSTKSLVGHTIGASGAIEAAVTALSLRDQRTHVSRNLESPIARLNFATEGLADASGSVPFSAPVEFGFSQSFAFGGHNAGLVIKRYS